jgi:hypothetical protein
MGNEQQAIEKPTANAMEMDLESPKNHHIPAAGIKPQAT